MRRSQAHERRVPGTLARFVAAEDGATAIEYALLGVLIALVIITAVGLLGEEVRAMFVALVAAF